MSGPSYKSGLVYVLYNPNIVGVKIGYTTRKPEQRVAELQGSGIPHTFHVVYAKYVENIVEFEKEIHHMLSQYRIDRKREFFNVSIKQAIEVIEDLYLEWYSVEILPELIEIFPSLLENKFSSIRAFIEGNYLNLKIEKNELNKILGMKTLRSPEEKNILLDYIKSIYSDMSLNSSKQNLKLEYISNFSEEEHLNYGILLYRKGNFQKAEEIFRMLIKENSLQIYQDWIVKCIRAQL